MDVTAAYGNELDAVCIPVVDWPSIDAEEVGDFAILLSTPIPDVPRFEDNWLSLEECEKPELDDDPGSEDNWLALEECETTELDDDIGFEGNLLSLEACETTEPDDPPEPKCGLLLLKALEMTELDDVPTTNGVVLLFKTCEISELDDSNTVLMFAVTAEPFTDFTFDPEGFDEVLTSACSNGRFAAFFVGASVIVLESYPSLEEAVDELEVIDDLEITVVCKLSVTAIEEVLP